MFDQAGIPARRRAASRVVRGALALAALAPLALTGTAHAVGNGLPLGYNVSRQDSPFPGAVAQYPIGLSNAGDVNGDGKDDYMTAQLVNTKNDAGVVSSTGNGAVYFIDSVTGKLLDTIEAPDKGNFTVSGGVTINNAANFGFPWISKIGTNRTAAPFTDLASCANPPTTPGGLCRSTTVGGPDGVADIVVGARGVDARDLVDTGRVYVYDGKTHALLKRIDAPASDTTPLALSRAGGSWFGRVVLTPASLPPCDGNAGIGACDTMPNAVASGDMTGGGMPDLVVSASAQTEDYTTAYPSSNCALTPGAKCLAAGRLYVYRGEDIVGSSPTEILDGAVPTGGTAETIVTIRHPHAQADSTSPTDSDSEQIGNYMLPIGDVGGCRALTGPPAVPVPPAGDMCPRAQSSSTPDGRPDYVAGVAAQDLPLDNPDPAYADAGVAYLIDGATNTILQILRNPNPWVGARYGSTDALYPGGDLGDTSLPDVLVGAPGEISDGSQAAGAAYVMNGNFKTGPGNVVISRLQDPSPVASENFGGTYTGVGDLVAGQATPANELLVGGPGGFFGAGPKPLILNDISFINAATGKVLQTIRDPDNQGATQFGGKLIPLGDLNGDGFLDFAASAQLHDEPGLTDAGRVYVFRSNNTPTAIAPPPPPPPASAAATTPPPPPAAATTGSSELQPGRCANDLRGTNDGDSLVGTVAGDAIFGLDGDDVIEALAGHDCVDAGADEDDIAGDAGNDSLLGGGADDELDGGPGADRVFGQTGNDTLVAGSGRDMLAGGEGNDKLTGAGGGADRLFGERGNDRLTGGDSAGNLLDGGSGNDHIDAVNGRRDTVRCGAGLDRATVDRIDRVSGCERVTRKRA